MTITSHLMAATYNPHPQNKKHNASPPLASNGDNIQRLPWGFVLKSTDAAITIKYPNRSDQFLQLVQIYGQNQQVWIIMTFHLQTTGFQTSLSCFVGLTQLWRRSVLWILHLGLQLDARSTGSFFSVEDPPSRNNTPIITQQQAEDIAFISLNL